MQVREIMTRDVLTLPGDASVAEGLRAAVERDVHHVLVADHGRLTGIICVCDLREQPRDQPLTRSISRRPEVVAPGSTLEQAADQFVQKGISCFPVCDGDDLVGVVTRRDVRRSLPPGHALPASFECAFCGSMRHVRSFGEGGAMAACLDCADHAAPAEAGLFDEGNKG
ncbi:MAG: CBS domain-containing protein [Myxococcales bacterium]|nr:CBS domain-containing protein [Myxococcales bacterium]